MLTISVSGHILEGLTDDQLRVLARGCTGEILSVTATLFTRDSAASMIIFLQVEGDLDVVVREVLEAARRADVTSCRIESNDPSIDGRALHGVDWPDELDPVWDEIDEHRLRLFVRRHDGATAKAPSQ